MIVFVCVLVVSILSYDADGQLSGPNRAQTISNIFQIPIQTLTAVSNVAQNTRPIGDIFEQAIMKKAKKQQLLQQLFSQQPQQQQQQQEIYDNVSDQKRPAVIVYSSNSIYNHPFGSRYYSSKAAQTAGLSVANDGSGFRI